MSNIEHHLRNVAIDFPFLDRVVYLDAAAVCPPPRMSLDVMTQYYLKSPLNYGVGEGDIAKQVADDVDRSRLELARFINASPDELVFTKNTTEAINIVARGVEWHAGDEIIVTSLEHQSNLIPWFRLVDEHGISVVVVPHGSDGLVHPEMIADRVNRRTRLIATTHVSNVFGTIQPIAEIAELAQSAGVMSLIDAAQSVGRLPLDVREIGADFVAFCGRKALMGPQGTGFLYIRRDAVGQVRALMNGSRAGNVKEVGQYEEAAAPYRFEAGVLNTAGVLGLSASVAYLESIGMKPITEHVRKISRLLHRELSCTKGVVVHSPWSESDQAGVISWSMPDAGGASDIARRLGRDNIVVGSGYLGSPLAVHPINEYGLVRTSVHWFTAEHEIGQLLKAIRHLST